MFLEGAESLAPLELPPVPTIDTLGLGIVLERIEAREKSLEALEIELDQILQRELREAEASLGAAIKQLSKELNEALPPDLRR